MSGLEAVEIRFMGLDIDNEKFRMDSEFFSKDFLSSYTLVKKRKFAFIGDITQIFTDFHANGSYESIAQNFELLDNPDFAYMVRSTDLEAKNYDVGVKYVSDEAYHFLSKSKVYGGELLINKIGSPGRAYLMPKLKRPVSLGMNLFMIRLKNDAPIRNTFVWLFLNTNFGKSIISRKVNGTVPLTIDKIAIKTLPIPIVCTSFQERLDSILLESERAFHKANDSYNLAKKMLLDELGLADFKPSNEPIAVKSFSESFGTSGRLDAEYYQPKYEELFAKLCEVRTSFLTDLAWIKKSVEPGSAEYINEGIPFVRVSDMTKHGLSTPEIHLSRVPFANMDLQPKKDTVLFTKDGTVGIAYKIEENMDMVTSSAILHLSVKNIDYILPDYLTLVLNSVVVQMQANRDVGGSIIQHWRVSEVEKVVIPILDMMIQEKISNKIQQSFTLRRQSEQLLEVAKRAVEIAIESSEDSAIKWLEEKNNRPLVKSKVIF